MNELDKQRKKAEIDYWNKNLWKWRCYVWLLRRIRKLRKKPNHADDRVCHELAALCKTFNRQLNVVDLCCGDVSSLTKRLLKNRQLNIIGVDISKKCALYSRAFKKCGFICVAADCEFAPIRAHSIDVAIIRNSLHHLTNLGEFFREVGRMLKHESLFLIVEVETKSSISNFVYHNILLEPNYPFVEADVAVACLKEEGFRINDFASLQVDSRRSYFIATTNAKP